MSQQLSVFDVARISLANVSLLTHEEFENDMLAAIYLADYASIGLRNHLKPWEFLESPLWHWLKNVHAAATVAYTSSVKARVKDEGWPRHCVKLFGKWASQL